MNNMDINDMLVCQEGCEATLRYKNNQGGMDFNYLKNFKFVVEPHQTYVSLKSQITTIKDLSMIMNNINLVESIDLKATYRNAKDGKDYTATHNVMGCSLKQIEYNLVGKDDTQELTINLFYKSLHMFKEIQ